MTSITMYRTRVLTCMVVTTLGLISGCGSDETESPTGKKLQAIGKLYLDYAINRNGDGPADEQAFKKHIRGLPDHVISSNGVDPKAIDDAFVSARDNQPFVILYGTRIGGVSAKDGALVAHEKTGKNGTFLAGLANGKAKQLDAAGLEELKTKKIEWPTKK